MDTEAVKSDLVNLQQRIQTASSSALTFENELERRKLWCELELLKMDIDDATKSVSAEAREVRFPNVPWLQFYLIAVCPFLAFHAVLTYPFACSLSSNSRPCILSWPRCSR